jgi:hypothetical protein
MWQELERSGDGHLSLVGDDDGVVGGERDVVGQDPLEDALRVWQLQEVR